MFGKVLSEVAGISDNCSVHFRDQALSHATFAHFLLPNEKPFILLKSLKAEYIFTNLAYIFSYGEAAAGKKRNINRYDYSLHKISNVSFETAGMSVTDQDCEIKFHLDGGEVSIDVKKPETELAIAVYRVLLQLSLEQQRDAEKMDLAKASLTQAHFHVDGEVQVNNHLLLVEQVITKFNPVSYLSLLEFATPR